MWENIYTAYVASNGLYRGGHEEQDGIRFAVAQLAEEVCAVHTSIRKVGESVDECVVELCAMHADLNTLKESAMWLKGAGCSAGVAKILQLAAFSLVLLGIFQYFNRTM
jgi:hypothetical protein